ncbi:polysaccharide lyase 8 family protein [Vibrio vulnificus]|uniref:polysaccharide lyase 8 family protein n=1 Tax=Vibrio vulnificus TaxID=672 RepID=UPI002FBF0CDB
MVRQSLLALTITSALLGCNSDSAGTSSDVTAPDSKFTEVRAHWAANYIGDASLPFDDQLTQATANISRNAAQWMQQFQSSRTNVNAGLWLDLPLATATEQDKKQLGDQLYKSYQRLFTMAQAYQLPKSDLYQSVELLDVITEGLAILNQHFYKVGVEEWGNWWHWQLGISRVANNILVLMYQELPASLVTNYIDAIEYFVPNPTHLSEGAGASASSMPRPFESTGANRVQNVQVVLVRALLANDQDAFQTAVDALEPVITFVESGDGFYSDGSFIQHTDIPYNGSYGNELLEGLGLLLGTIASAPWNEQTEQYSAIYSLLLEAYAPFLVDGRMMDMVNGRAVSRLSGQNHKIGHAVLNSMLFFIESAPSNVKKQLQSVIKTNIENDTFLDFYANPRFFRNQQLARQLADDTTVNMLTDRRQHKQFPAMDRIVHHRPDWSFAIAMHSNRVGNYECINGENLKGWYSADGVTYLYNQQLDHYTNYWPVVDPYHLAGTTTIDSSRENCSGQLRGDGKRQDQIQWSGGTSLDQYGIAGFDFTNWDDTLSAKKSWFMFDEQIVALGSNVTNPAALTNLENRKIIASAQVKANGISVEPAASFEGDLERLDITVDGQNNPISYLLLNPQTATVTKACRSGNYNTIGTNNAAVNACFTQAELKHDSSDQYQYVLFPNSTKSVVDREAIAPSIHVLSNSENVHAVEHTQLKLVGLNFWQPGQAGAVEAFNPMSMLYRTNSDKSLTVSISNPTRSSLSVKFKFDDTYITKGDLENRITTNNDGSFTIDLTDLQGRSYQFALIKEQ